MQSLWEEKLTKVSPPKFRPLSGRINVILSRNEKLREDMDIPEEVLISSSLDAAMEELCQGVSSSRVAKIFVIGGGSIYEEAMKSPHCSIVHLTSVQGSFEGLDTFFPTVPAQTFMLASRGKLAVENGIPYRFMRFDRIQNDDELELDECAPSRASS